MHEQGHFDITEIIKRQYSDSLRDAKAGAVSYSAQHAAALAKNLLIGRIKEKYLSYIGELSREQTRYDAETSHGSDAAAQARYNGSLGGGAIPHAPAPASRPTAR